MDNGYTPHYTPQPLLSATVQRELEASVQSDLHAIEANIASSFAVLVEEALSTVVANAILLGQGLQILQFDVAVIAVAMEMFLLEVAREEAKAMSVLCESNYTFIARLLETNLNVCRSRRQWLSLCLSSSVLQRRGTAVSHDGVENGLAIEKEHHGCAERLSPSLFSFSLSLSFSPLCPWQLRPPVDQAAPQEARVRRQEADHAAA
eukprot:3007198-Amphidinium_carterae.1